jgi:23S rRNA (cytidine1920-2'-O)/16S rRNA (cytidine1409-2'-O)-methyltransferase
LANSGKQGKCAVYGRLLARHSPVCYHAIVKERLDVLVAERGLADSRAQAQRLIRTGRVRVDGQLADKPGTRVRADADVTLKELPPFVSRGGEKLAAALDAFELDVTGTVCADVGASTGGFTDCLLQRGACRVYAIDVGYGQLDWRLRNDERVVVMERTNARYLEQLPEPVSVVTIDVSFISLDLILPKVVGWLVPRQATGVGANGAPDGEGRDVVALIKPQFEAGRRDVQRGGVVRDPEVHQRVLISVLDTANGLGLGLCGLIASPLRGPAGNVEFLAWWQAGVRGRPPQPLIAAGLEQAETSG